MINKIRWLMVFVAVAMLNFGVFLHADGWMKLVNFIAMVGCAAYSTYLIMEIEYCFGILKSTVVYSYQVGQKEPELAQIIVGKETIQEWQAEADIQLEDAKHLVARCSLRPDP
jgi:hypothetical protein